MLHVLEWPTWPGYSERERLVIEFAERFALDHESLDDDVFGRLSAHFDDAEILELAVCVARHLGFGRLTRVLDLDGDEHDHSSREVEDP
ncbi:MAG: hypothetical protein KDB21_21055 [Acidimicrobiales bacterium]|nr:hypothetical protein [Acidimicrobiales bacterium]